MSLVPYVVEQTNRGERSYDIFSRLLQTNHRGVFLLIHVDPLLLKYFLQEFLPSLFYVFPKGLSTGEIRATMRLSALKRKSA